MYSSKRTSGSSIKDELMSVWRQTGMKPAELDRLVEAPESLYYMWKIFIDLNGTRSSGFAENPISYSEIKAYSDLFNIQFEEWEIMMITKLDRTYMEVRAEIAEKEKPRKPKQ